MKKSEVVEQSGPFTPAEGATKRMKLLLWGDSGVGKTVLALQFPSPAVIDLEGGTDHYGERFKFDRLRATTPDEIADAIQWLTCNKHGYKTLVIDPITVYWEALQKKYSDILLRVSEKKPGQGGNKYEFYDLQPKDWMAVKAEWKELIRNLTALDMNVIVTARQKTKYASGSGDMMRVIGETFDGEKTLSYAFDTVVSMDLDGQGKRICRVQKDRTMKMPGEAFETNYQVFAKAFGEAALSRKSKPTILATDEQLMEMRQLVEVLKLSPDRVASGLARYGVRELERVTTEQAVEVIAALKKKVNTEAEKEEKHAES